MRGKHKLILMYDLKSYLVLLHKIKAPFIGWRVFLYYFFERFLRLPPQGILLLSNSFDSLLFHLHIPYTYPRKLT